MRAVTRWWFAPAPAERLAALRIAIGGFALFYLTVRLVELREVAGLPASMFEPVGLVRLLAEPLPVAAVLAIAGVTWLLLVAFVAGFAYRWTAPLAALALVWTLSYRNSWGQVFHTENLFVLHVIALACAPAADAWAVRRRPVAAAAAGYGWAIKLLIALTAATYLIAGLAKLRISGLHWLDGSLLRDQVAVDNLRKAVLGDSGGSLALPLLGHPGLCALLAGMTLVVELGAPLALIGGRIAQIWALAAWAFHLGVWLVMHISFPYPLWGLAYLPLFEVERVREWLFRRAGCNRACG